VRAEHEIVEALEALAVMGREDRLDRPARGVELHQAPPVVADEDAAIFVNLQPIRPAVVLADEIAIALGREPEHTSKRDVDEIEIAVAVERWPFEKAVDLLSEAVRVRPFGARLRTKLVGQAEMHARPHALELVENEHVRSLDVARNDGR